MKILHALVGYLAAAALPLHWQPLAFASPMAAIDYDGYDAATKRVLPASGDIVEARQAEVIPIAILVAADISAVVLSILWVLDDDPKRKAFTQNTISKMISQYPKWNWVICHSPHSVGFDGVEGKDWGYTHHELGISFGKTIGYDIYWARSGTFYRYGDGGFINWAYNGNILGTDNGGATVHFGRIS